MEYHFVKALMKPESAIIGSQKGGKQIRNLSGTAGMFLLVSGMLILGAIFIYYYAKKGRIPLRCILMI